MAYCVNCGVELSSDIRKCPLCATPVINPANLEMIMAAENPFPAQKGQVETVKRKDVAILNSSVLLALSVLCGILNIFFFHSIKWSLAVTGVCILIWVFLIPFLIAPKISAYLATLLDGVAMGFALFLIAVMLNKYDWYWKLGVQIIALFIVLLEAFLVCTKKVTKSRLGISFFVFTGVALFCLGLDLLISIASDHPITFSWSVVVAAVCGLFDVIILTLFSRKRLRDAVRRRLHF